MTALKDLKILPPKILLWGPAGRGKTALAMTLGARLKLIDLDNGVRTGMTLNDKWLQDRMAVDVDQCIEADPTKATAFSRAKSFADQFATSCRSGSCKFKALCLDSLTTLADFAVRHVMHSNGKLGQAPQIQHWGMAFSEIENVLLTLRSLPVVVVLIAHQQIDMIDDHAVASIACPGVKLPGKITSYFDEIWYMKVTPAGGGKMDYKLTTRGTESIICRSRGNLATDTNIDVGLASLIKSIGYDIDS